MKRVVITSLAALLGGIAVSAVLPAEAQSPAPPTATPAEVKNPSVRSRLLIFILLFLGAVGVTISMIRYWPGITGFVRPSTAAVEEAKPENVESVPTSDEDSLQRALEEHDRLFNTKD